MAKALTHRAKQSNTRSRTSQRHFWSMDAAPTGHSAINSATHQWIEHGAAGKIAGKPASRNDARGPCSLPGVGNKVLAQTRDRRDKTVGFVLRVCWVFIQGCPRTATRGAITGITDALTLRRVVKGLAPVVPATPLTLDCQVAAGNSKRSLATRDRPKNGRARPQPTPPEGATDHGPHTGISTASSGQLKATVFLDLRTACVSDGPHSSSLAARLSGD